MANKVFFKVNKNENISKQYLNSVKICLDEEDGIVGSNFLKEISQYGQPKTSSIYFLILAISVYIADKIFLRKNTKNYWTRNIEIFSILNKKLHENQVNEMLSFLTGDEWRVKFRRKKVNYKFKKSSISFNPNAIVLFSGGLDSLIGAIDLLESGEKIILLSHYEGGVIPKYQNILSRKLIENYGEDHVKHCSMFFRLRKSKIDEQFESTTRSRSILFIALGLCLASIYNSIPLIIPENGFISLNSPLTIGRLGSYSTRTTHPFFIEKINQFIAEVGITNSVKRMYELKTKGEMIKQCKNIQLLKSIIHYSISCSHPEVLRWKGEKSGSCGYCFPCIIRRAALNKVGIDRGEDYFYDVCSEEDLLYEIKKGADLRALLLNIYGKSNDDYIKDVIRTALTSKVINQIDKYIDLQIRAIKEINDLFTMKGNEKLKEYADI